jgi:hypothetical protein
MNRLPSRSPRFADHPEVHATVSTLGYARWALCVLLLALLCPATAFAMVCAVQDSGAKVVSDDLGSTVAIPENLAQGEIVWRSQRHELQVECAKDSLPSVQEDIYLQINPDNLSIGQGIRAGITLAGIDYVQGDGRIATGQSLPVCREGEGNVAACPKARFNLTFSVFIQKYGPTPPSGVASDLLDYRLFQMRSGVGPAPLPGESLDYRINNLSVLRFIACDAQLQVQPEIIEFGNIGIQQVEVGRVIARRPFSLVTSRTCASPFSLGARFRPVRGAVSGNLLIPSGNDAVGIRLLSAASESILPYNEPFHLANLLGDTESTHVDFNAELVWQKTAPSAGPFEAQLMIDLFYQ